MRGVIQTRPLQSQQTYWHDDWYGRHVEGHGETDDGDEGNHREDQHGTTGTAQHLEHAVYLRRTAESSWTPYT